MSIKSLTEFNGMFFHYYSDAIIVIAEWGIYDYLISIWISNAFFLHTRTMLVAKNCNAIKNIHQVSSADTKEIFFFSSFPDTIDVSDRQTPNWIKIVKHYASCVIIEIPPVFCNGKESIKTLVPIT